MAERSFSLLVITNASELNSQKTKNNSMERKKKHVPGMCCLQETHFNQTQVGWI